MGSCMSNDNIQLVKKDAKVYTKITCQICYQKYDRNKRLPMSLPCYHTICLKCLKHLEKKQCPFDRKPFKNYGRNHQLYSLLDPNMQLSLITEISESQENKQNQNQQSFQRVQEQYINGISIVWEQPNRLMIRVLQQNQLARSTIIQIQCSGQNIEIQIPNQIQIASRLQVPVVNNHLLTILQTISNTQTNSIQDLLDINFSFQTDPVVYSQHFRTDPQAPLSPQIHYKQNINTNIVEKIVCRSQHSGSPRKSLFDRHKDFQLILTEGGQQIKKEYKKEFIPILKQKL